MVVKRMGPELFKVPSTFRTGRGVGGSRGGSVLGEGRVDNHTFRTAIEEGVSTDFLTRLLFHQEDSESDRRRPYISYGSFRVQDQSKSV